MAHPSSADRSTAPKNRTATLGEAVAIASTAARPRRRFDLHHQWQSFECRREPFFQDPNRVRPTHLRYHQRVGPDPSVQQRREVPVAQGGRRLVDPKHDLGAARLTLGEQRHGVVTRLVFLRERHTVFEVETDGVGPGSDRFRESIGTDGRHEEHRASDARYGHGFGIERPRFPTSDFFRMLAARGKSPAAFERR